MALAKTSAECRDGRVLIEAFLREENAKRTPIGRAFSELERELISSHHPPEVNCT